MSEDLEDSLQRLAQTIASLEAQRALLGDATVDAALAPLRERLQALSGAGQPGPAAPAPASLVRQLRQVSVLFLDVVGSTALSQKLDPESLQRIVDGALALFSDTVRAHGGEVLQYAGDNLLAAFGAQQAREDDAERAVRCGLALLEQATQQGQLVLQQTGHAGFNARVGIHTGTVLRGGGVNQDNTLRGLPVSIAARMEQAAPPGALRISQDTWALVRGLFDADLQPPLMVKGQDTPVTSWIVQREKPLHRQGTGRGVGGRETPLVGRQGELAQLQAALQAVNVAPDGPALRVVTVLADAGTGKSRLIHEFSSHAVESGGCWLLPGRSQPSGTLQPYGLWHDVMSRSLGIADSDTGEQARATLLRALQPWLSEPHDPAPELLGQLLGLDFSDSAAVQALGGDRSLLRRRALEVLRLWLQRRSLQQCLTLVLQLDDLHWTDDASLDLLQELLPRLECRVVAVLGARPALLERRPKWTPGEAQHSVLVLQPLEAAGQQELVLSLLRPLGTPPAELVEMVCSRAAGNPYYAEELVQMLLDQQVIEATPEAWIFHPDRLQPHRLPTTLVGVLQARLDALDPSPRRALQLASVIGPVFWDEALAALQSSATAELPALQARSMVWRRPDSAFEDTAEEVFQHHLLHQVSYETVLPSERQAAHARAAAWLTSRAGDRGDEVLAITAQHHERAGQPAEAARWFERAARQARLRAAYQAALDYSERALHLGGSLLPAEWRARQLDEVAGDCDLLGQRERQQAAIDELLALAEAHDNDHWRALGLASLTLLADGLGDTERALQSGRDGAAAAERANVPVSAALCRGNLGWLAIMRNDLAEADTQLRLGLEAARQAAREARAPNDHHYEVQLLLVWSELHSAQGDRVAQGQVLQEALEKVRKRPAPSQEVVCMAQLIPWFVACGDRPMAARTIAELRQLALRLGHRHIFTYALNCDAAWHLDTEQPAAAAELAREALALARELGAQREQLDAQDLLAEAAWRQGQSGDAAVLWREVAEQLAERKDALDALVARLMHRLAALAPAGGNPEPDLLQAVRDELAALAAEPASPGLTTSARGWWAAAQLLEAAGDTEGARRCLVQVSSWVAQRLASHTEVEVRRRVRSHQRWLRDFDQALVRAGLPLPMET